jgi:N-acetyl-1-D-myo-inositol-2-amino-2-deoxy-alpha-D-glucopyranoside deacetylase
MNKPRTLLLTGAHPDDESFGIGGTLAQYAAKGYKVYYVCGTRGEVGEVAPEFMKNFKTVAELRTHELDCAAKELGLTDVIYLGYRDSGMAGTPDNKHPKALAAAPTEKVAVQIVKILRELKPEVVITSDPNGGYGHPDHIAIHKATALAFDAVGDANKYPEAGPPFQPQKLYYHVFSVKFFKFMLKVWQLLGRDVHHMGRNKDIDFTEFMELEYPIHCAVRLKKKSLEIRDRAAACHASQLGGGGGGRQGGLMGLLEMLRKLFGQRDCYMRVYPPVEGRVNEHDLFQGIK